jgi:hypothetical protein
MKPKLSRGVAKAVLQKEGRIFGATYQKKNGEITKINGRFGVHKFVKGTGQSSPNVWTVWDNNRKRYTALIPENIQTITYGGYEYEMK